MDADAYRRLRAEARRHARRAVDADDLVQDALLIALELGRSDDPAWLAGVIRNQAAIQARSAILRRRRETAVAEDEVSPGRRSEPHRPSEWWIECKACIRGGLASDYVDPEVGPASSQPRAFRAASDAHRFDIGSMRAKIVSWHPCAKLGIIESVCRRAP